MGCDLARDDTSEIESVVAALKERPWGAKLPVAGKFSTKLSEPEGDRGGEYIAAALATEGLGYMSAHFLLNRHSWCRDRRIWSMIQEGGQVRSRTDYILGTDGCLFWNVSVQDPMHNSDHYMVLGCLRSSPLREQAKYLGGSKRNPLPTPNLPNEGGRNLGGPLEGRPKSPGTGSEDKLVDLGGHVETRRQESLHAPRSYKGPGPHSEVYMRHRGKFKGR